MPDYKKIAYSTARVTATLILLVLAGVVGWRLWVYYQLEPWTRDGRVRADIVQIAPDVSGLVTKVSVTHDEIVKAGQVIFTIDQDRYALALRQAEAAVATQQAAIIAQEANVDAHEAALAEARREATRNDGLSNLIAREVLEQSHSKVAQEAAAVAQAKAAVGQAQSALAQAEATHDVAVLNLERTVVRAPVDGVMSDISLRVGEYVSPGKAVLAEIDAASLRVEGYFEETKLPRIHVGDAVEVRLMGDETLLSGHIQSIAGAIEDRERAASANLLPNVNPTFSWVRLAQRVPVRVHLDQPPANIRLIAGRTATVTVLDDKGRRP
jgi:multidrug resistance efflux pump